MTHSVVHVPVVSQRRAPRCGAHTGPFSLEGLLVDHLDDGCSKQAHRPSAKTTRDERKRLQAKSR